jgi:hypothetical protein
MVVRGLVDRDSAARLVLTRDGRAVPDAVLGDQGLNARQRIEPMTLGNMGELGVRSSATRTIIPRPI